MRTRTGRTRVYAKWDTFAAFDSIRLASAWLPRDLFVVGAWDAASLRRRRRLSPSPLPPIHSFIRLRRDCKIIIALVVHMSSLISVLVALSIFSHLLFLVFYILLRYSSHFIYFTQFVLFLAISLCAALAFIITISPVLASFPPRSVLALPPYIHIPHLPNIHTAPGRDRRTLHLPNRHRCTPDLDV
ncbi:hypothetical protein BDW22DRAFT_638304 [Trametopsis cervina]|nr:hypothetical protein BDW22DRAFT_638304 [Trametopsis cervina]